jgi:hypothetical protein
VIRGECGGVQAVHTSKIRNAAFEDGRLRKEAAQGKGLFDQYGTQGQLLFVASLLKCAKARQSCYTVLRALMFDGWFGNN